jgi:hypothetical protein
MKLCILVLLVWLSDLIMRILSVLVVGVWVGFSKMSSLSTQWYGYLI